MADLQVCYFCGSGPDGSLGEYAVVPSALDPTEDQQRSVVLCPDCRGKLTTVMEPVVEAAGPHAGSDAGGASPGAGGTDADGTSAGTGNTGASGASDRASGADASAQPDGATDTGALGGSAGDGGHDEPAVGNPAARDAASDPDVADSPAGTAPSGEPDPSSESADTPSAESSAGTDDVAVPPSDPDDANEGVSIGAGGAGPGASDAGEPRAPFDDVTEGADDAAGDSDGAAGAPDDALPESNAPRDQPHADDELVGRNNEAYNKTLRLLQNREFPVERHEIEKVAANAYQLDPQEVSDAIDALIQKGMLTQEGAHLQRP